MLSIITTVYNQAGMNRLFYERLVRNTTLPYELIVVDNGSTDGSLAFFRERADVTVANGANYSYPYCQNRGAERAKYDILVFINNDVLVPRGWDARLLEVMRREKLDALTPATNDHLESVRAQKRLNNRWKRVKYPLRFLFGTGYANLRLMAALTYGSLDRFADRRYRRFGTATVEGFSGSCMVLTRRALELMGGGFGTNGSSRPTSTAFVRSRSAASRTATSVPCRWRWAYTCTITNASPSGHRIRPLRIGPASLPCGRSGRAASWSC